MGVRDRRPPRISPTKHTIIAFTIIALSGILKRMEETTNEVGGGEGGDVVDAEMRIYVSGNAPRKYYNNARIVIF